MDIICSHGRIQTVPLSKTYFDSFDWNTTVNIRLSTCIMGVLGCPKISYIILLEYNFVPSISRVVWWYTKVKTKSLNLTDSKEGIIKCCLEPIISIVLDNRIKLKKLVCVIFYVKSGHIASYSHGSRKKRENECVPFINTKKIQGQLEDNW